MREYEALTLSTQKREITAFVKKKTISFEVGRSEKAKELRMEIVQEVYIYV